ncbi:MAG TPA: hypothetical protein PKD85_08985 [Saprospiraceae bacterium]|nr:hypothetical protein [Saprospiraceae bacterium]
MAETSFIKYDGTLDNGETIIKVYFQSQKTINMYQSGNIDEDVGLTLKSGKKTTMYWFDSQEDKQRWLKDNLTFVKK